MTMLKIFNKITFFIAFFSLFNFYLAADDSWWATSFYPVITETTNNDPVFMQHQQDVAYYFSSAVMDVENRAPVGFYLYRTSEDEDSLIKVAAKFNITYTALATLNEINHSGSYIPGQWLLLPNQSGLFVADNAVGTLQKFIFSNRKSRLESLTPIRTETPEGSKFFYFLVGEHFDSLEFAFFNHILFVNPLADGTLTSSYGKRLSPVSNRHLFHHGVDIAAPMGTPVLAANSGYVDKCDYSPIYGLYVVISHENGYSTLYGHLSRTFCETGQFFNAGSVIGEVGNSGLSTGPHLHFAIYKNNSSVNPQNMISDID